MRRILATTCIIFLLGITYSVAQTTYTSAGSGAWNNTASWSPSGIPSRTDNVIILSGHTITVSAVTDNNAGGGQSPDGLGRPNVGPFTTSDLLEFYHTGDITVEVGGTLDATERMMLEGTVTINGSYTTSSDIVILGKFNVASGATLTSGDDLILSGGSRTIIDNTPVIGDDVYIDHTDAQLCGSGDIQVGSAPDGAGAGIQYLNGGTSAQLCSGIIISCVAAPPGAGCNGTVPDTGTGNFTLDLTTFNYAKTFTINSSQVTGDLTDFPVLIKYTDASIRTSSDIGTADSGVENINGYDIVFATADDCGVLTQLDHQLESYSSNATDATLIAWVKVPAVSSTVDTDIYMYYGNSSVSQDISVTTTFDYDFISVWHMQEDPGGTAPQVLDATSSGNDATSNGTMSGNVSGQIANAIQFDGTNDYLQTTSGELQSENNFTVSAWFNNLDAVLPVGPSHIIWQGVTGINGWGTSPAGTDREMHLSLGYCCPAGAIGSRISSFLGDIEQELDNGVLSIDGGSFTANNNWYYGVATFSDLAGTPTSELWLDGSSLNSDLIGTVARLDRTGWINLRIGSPGALARLFNGQIDEVRISKVVRSDAWIQTEYNNQSDPSTFFTVTSGATVSPCGPLPIELMYFRGKIQDHKVLLEWATASEINNDYFTVERSTDGLAFHELTTIPGAGNSNLTLNYNYTDKNPFFGISYYRLKQTDYDGQFTHSNVIVIKLDHGLQELDFTLFPNPTKDMLNVQITGNTVLDVRIEMYNAQGQRLDNIVSTRKIDGFELNVEHLTTGIYLVHLINENYRGIRKFVKE